VTTSDAYRQTADQPLPQVVSGAVVAYRLFDIADLVDLARSEELWTAAARGTSQRGRLAATHEKAVAFGVAPVTLPLKTIDLDLAGVHRTAQVSARLFEFGAVSIAVHVPLADLGWAAFREAVNALHGQFGPGMDGPWQEWLASLRETVAPALTRPNATVLEEDYLVVLVNSLDTPVRGTDLIDRLDLASLLAGEDRALSAQARASLLQQAYSYYADDLVLLTWDRAFVYEPRGDSDVLDVLEVANAQLLEMRYYDSLLDAELARMYVHLGEMRRGQGPFMARRYATLARRLRATVAEVTELTEKVENALKVTEDVYLARVYSAALGLFRVAAVGATVQRKLAIIRESYTALYEEAAGSRGTLLELLIIMLISVEIFLTLVRY